jgi:response regulator of citrate/malate metabolism
LRPEQVPEVREALQRYRQAKEILEAISELNQCLLRLDRDEWKERNA